MGDEIRRVKGCLANDWAKYFTNNLIENLEVLSQKNIYAVSQYYSVQFHTVM